MKGFFLVILAAALSAFVIPAAWRLAPRIGMIDQPDPRKVHRVPVPRVGGWGIVAGGLVPLLLVQPLDVLLQSFVAGSLVLFCFGAWDDARQVGHWHKFVGQVIAVTLVVWWGDLYVTRLPFLDGLELAPAAGRVFTAVAMIGVINAINHSDGLDGLAAGESILTLVALVFLGHLAGNGMLMATSLAVIGGTLGFLRYNTHPARVFMGDAGSQFLGFSLAFLVVYFVERVNPAVSAAVPLLLLGLPLADILAVLYLRMRGGLNWFKATRNHVHHRLLDLGFSHFQAVVTIYAMQAALVVGAVSLRYQSDLVVLAAYLLPVLLLFLGLHSAERTSWRLGVKQPARAAPVPRSRLLAGRRGLLAGITAATGVTLLSLTLSVPDTPSDFRFVALAMGSAVVPAMILRWRYQSVLIRVATFVLAACVTYLYTQAAAAFAHPWAALVDAWMILLGVAIGLFVGAVEKREFAPTPTDYLALMAMIALAVFSGMQGIPPDARAAIRFVAYSVVLFYAFEVICTQNPHWVRLLGPGSVGLVLVLGFGGFVGRASGG